MEAWLAIAALLLSLISLAWQAYSWRRNGPDPKITAFVREVEDGADVVVTVANRGRGPCQILAVAVVDLDGGWNLKQFVRDGSPPVPTQLDAHSSLGLIVDGATLCRSIWPTLESPHVVWLGIKLGDGTNRISRPLSLDVPRLRVHGREVDLPPEPEILSSTEDPLPPLPPMRSRRKRGA